MEISGYVIFDKATKVSKGFGFLNFPEDQLATQCIIDCDYKLEILTKKIKLVKAPKKTQNDVPTPIPT
jgi:hypothetical protein